jgi:ribosomal protein S18 acetylase RimI-like enzyme
MILPPHDLQIRPAVREDHRLLSKFLHYETHVHRHLDWRAPLEWLGEQPFLLAFYEKSLQGVLACPPDPPGIAWVRLFGSSAGVSSTRIWEALFEQARIEASRMAFSEIAAIAFNDWFIAHLKNSGFINRQDIVVLEWSASLPPLRPLPPELTIRQMSDSDLPAVQQVDALAFAPLWQNSLNTLEQALEQAAWSTVAEINGEIVGYQISTAMPLSGHLARLAVTPTMRRSNIGYELTRDMLEYFKRQRAWRVTVNTQNDNHASLALYKQLGFIRTGDEFPVYEVFL